MAESERAAVLVDAALAVAVTTAISVAIAAKVEPDARDPDLVAYGFAVAVGALMLIRRRWPAGVLAATVLLWFVYYALGYPAVGVGVPVAGALYAAAERGRLRFAVAAAAGVLVLSTAYRATDGESLTRLLGFDAAENLVLLVAVIALGDGVRSRRELRRRAAEEAAAAARDHERQARRQLEQERVRIARDVHDVLAHAISAISIQSQVALEALPAEPAAATAALGNIRRVSGTALTDLRSTLGVLRDSASGNGAEPSVEAGLRVPVGGLADVDRLAGVATDSGLRVTINRTGDLAGLPLMVDTAAHRIVQESLTNVVRHAPSSSVTVDIHVGPGRLELLIRDSGRAAGVPGRSGGNADTDSGDRERVGFGLAGMRERAELLGGAVQSSPTGDGGYQVHAVLPFGVARPDGNGAAPAGGAAPDGDARPDGDDGSGAAIPVRRPVAGSV